MANRKTSAKAAPSKLWVRNTTCAPLPITEDEDGPKIDGSDYPQEVEESPTVKEMLAAGILTPAETPAPAEKGS